MNIMNTTEEKIIRTCRRCGYEWEQRGVSCPKQCPYCKSPKWALNKKGDKQ